MSIRFSGSLKRSGGLTQAVAAQVKQIKLKPVKKIVIKFDPFHEKIKETRAFLYSLTAPKVLSTNLNCKIKTEIVCDRSDPEISIDLVNGDSVVFKSALLSELEMFKLFNKHITSLVPKEEAPELLTKSSKQKLVKRK